MDKYTPQQVKEVLHELGLQVVQDWRGQYGVYCPFHPNSSSPAMTVSKTSGLWFCFNPACDSRGNLPQLVMRMTERDYFGSLRFIGLRSEPVDHGESIADALNEMFEDEQKFPHIPQAVVDVMVEQFWQYIDPQEYMLNRGFSVETLRFFEIGLSLKEGDLVTYPVHVPDGTQVCGVVGRGFREKRFKNSTNLPKSRILFNLHRARRHSSTVIVTESGFDAMMIHQAGFPNVVATLGANIPSGQLELLERNFTKIIVFSDNDEAGDAMFEEIRSNLKRLILRPKWDYDTIYPDKGKDDKPPKDACDLTASQIKTMITQADNDWF